MLSIYIYKQETIVLEYKAVSIKDFSDIYLILEIIE